MSYLCLILLLRFSSSLQDYHQLLFLLPLLLLLCSVVFVILLFSPLPVVHQLVRFLFDLQNQFCLHSWREKEEEGR